MMRMKSEAEVADDFESHFAENAGHYLDPELVSEAAGAYENWSSIVKVLGFADPELISTFADNAGKAIAWLKTFGVRFDFLPGYFITTCTSRMGPVGGGLALIEALAAWAERTGRTSTTAARRASSCATRMAPLPACRRPADARRLALRAPATVLACGGFEGNPEMLTQYLGPRARYLRPVARGGYYNKGEGLRMALAAGAAPSGTSASSMPNRSIRVRARPNPSSWSSITACWSTSEANASSTKRRQRWTPPTSPSRA